MRSLAPLILLVIGLSFPGSGARASQLRVDDALTLSDLVKLSSHIAVVAHSPPTKPQVTHISTVHLKVLKKLKGSVSKGKKLKVIHFQEDLLAASRAADRTDPNQSVVIKGYPSPLSLEEALRGKFVVFLKRKRGRYHFAAPGALAPESDVPAIRALLAKRPGKKTIKSPHPRKQNPK